jgi:hypothetical protein
LDIARLYRIIIRVGQDNEFDGGGQVESDWGQILQTCRRTLIWMEVGVYEHPTIGPKVQIKGLAIAPTKTRHLELVPRREIKLDVAPPRPRSNSSASIRVRCLY